MDRNITRRLSVFAASAALAGGMVLAGGAIAFATPGDGAPVAPVAPVAPAATAPPPSTR